MNKIEKLLKELCPEGVERVKLGEVCSRIFAGGTPNTRKADYYDGDVPWIRSGEVDFNRIYHAERCITTKGLAESSAKMMKAKSVVMAMTGATVAKVATVEIETTANQSVATMECDESKLHYRYLYFYLEQNYHTVKSSAQGALTSLNLQMIRAIEIPLPPLSIQQEIVSILDKFTATLDNLDKELELRQKQYEEYREKLLTFEDGECEWKKIIDIGVVTKLAGFEFTEYVNYSESGTIIALRGLNVKDGKIILDDVKYIDNSDFSKLNRSKLHIGDILFTYVGTVGQVGLIEDEDKYYLAPNVALIRINKEILSPKYAIYYFQTFSFKAKQLEKLTSASSMKNITMGKIREFEIPVSPLPRQQQIVTTLDKFESLIANLKRERELRQKQYEYYREKLLTFE